MPLTGPNLHTEMLSRVADLVSRTFGLAYPPSRLSDLARGFTAAARELGWHDPNEAIAAFNHADLNDTVLGVLANHLTIGETYFFRHSDVFDSLVRDFLPQRLQACKGGEGPIRIWSAGCSSGEELYSIAMLLSELGIQLPSDDVTLIGTDICASSLEKATLGVYSEWSFRGLPEHLRVRYFHSAGARQFCLDPALVRSCAFRYLNLADTIWTTCVGQDLFDVVACRNVLLYFEEEAATSVMRRLVARLRPDGWLVLGPCEVHLAYHLGLEPVPGCAVIFRHPRRIELQVQEQPVDTIPAAVAVYQEALRLMDVGQVDHALALLVPLMAESPAPEIAAVMARGLANQGHLEAAEAVCRAALLEGHQAAELHCLLGTILQERGEEEAALLSHRRALNLDGDHLLALVSSGLLLHRRGQRREAEACLGRAVDLLGRDDLVSLATGAVDVLRLGELLADAGSNIR